MKNIILGLLLISSSAYGSMPTVRDRNVTCEELKEMFASYKSVYVIYGLVGFSRAPFWETKEDAQEHCPGRVDAGTFETSDTNWCSVGYRCAKTVRN